MQPSFLLLFLALVWVSRSNADSIVILGGEVDSLLNPAIAEVETIGPCGLYDSGIPPLENNIRQFSGVEFEKSLVVCGGYGLFTAHKECYSLQLGTWPLVWGSFPPLNHGRHNFGLVAQAGKLYAIGGSSTIGSVRSLEVYSPEVGAWEVMEAETNGYRQDFCSLPWGDDGILAIGGYDDLGHETRTELFNVTSGKWSLLANLNIGRGMHACAKYRGGVAAAGGWVFNNDPDFPGQEISSSIEWYDPENNTWTEITQLRHWRSEFAFDTINGTLTAAGGFEGDYLDTVEFFNPQEDGWEYRPDRLKQAKAGFAYLRVETLLEELECA